MKGRKRRFGFLFIPLIIIGAFFYLGHQWGEKHAMFMTGGEPHPPNCLACHLYLDQDSKMAQFVEEKYLSPLNMKVGKDGKSLYITAHESNEFLIVDTESGLVTSRIPVGIWPHSVAVDRENKMAYVSNHWSQNISVIDLGYGTVVQTIEVGAGPSDLVLDPSDKFLYVNNSFSSNVSIIDLDKSKEIKRITTGNFPIGIAITPNGQRVYVTHRRTKPVPFRTEPITEVSVIDTKYQRVVDRKEFKSAHIMENIDITPDGELALLTLIKPKNLVPSTQIENGFMITEGIGVIETKEGGKTAQFLLDEPNRYFADPYDIVISPDGERAYISHAGVDYISVLDINAIKALMSTLSQEQLDQYTNFMGARSRLVIARIKTGPNPKGLAISPDGDHVYLAERFADQVAVLGADSLKISNRFDLGGPKTETLVRQGGRLFFNAGRTFQNQYSCSTCHPDGSDDGLTWDLTGTGRNLENTISLRELSNTSPFKWNGKNVSVYMQCGMRFSKFVTRTESFNPDDLNALVAFIFQKLENPPNTFQLPNGQLTEAQQRGKLLFERTTTMDGREIPENARCVTCHPAPYFTDRRSADVGSRFETDSDIFFDTPKLNNIVDTPPYLHDGRAQTLEEIWTLYSGKDSHGYVNDMTKQELNDMIEYLRSIGPAHTYKEIDTKQARYE